MKLFQYTALHHVTEIWKHGAIDKGGIPVPDASGKFLAGHVPGWQWLTDDPEWHQSWATQITLHCDRTECRMVLEIPVLELHRLKRWDAVAAEFGYPPDLAKAFAEIGGGTVHSVAGTSTPSTSSHWFVFQGPIPITWIVGLERRPAHAKVGRTKRSRRRAAVGDRR